MVRVFAAVFLLVTLNTVTAAPAATQSAAKIAAVVNSRAITVHDVRSRMALIFMTARIANTAATRKKLLSQVLNQLVIESIQSQEAKRLRIGVSDREVAQTLAQIEKQNRMPSGRLLKILRARKVNPSTLVDQVKASLAWSKIIRRSIASNIRITDGEVDDAIARLNANKNRQIYRILEIYIPAERNDGGAGALRTTRRLIAQIRRGASFGGLARQFSQSSTASKGGDMGFVFEGQLAPELESAIKRVKPGQIIGPVRTSTGYYILALTSKRTYGSGKPPTRKQVENSIFQRKLSVRARQYLRDLRRAAFVDIRI